jgi:hypothetical protein
LPIVDWEGQAGICRSAGLAAKPQITQICPLAMQHMRHKSLKMLFFSAVNDSAVNDSLRICPGGLPDTQRIKILEQNANSTLRKRTVGVARFQG